ncbi:MAG: Tetratricopeptide 2 repeat protein [Myxococcales bacterium]|nr:Tetratricopeptide 2 repeat protein [Myxococcales bacterium]
MSSLVEARKGTVPTGADRARLVRRAKAAGPAVVPKLVAALSATADGESGWAYHLLARIGGARVIGALERLCAGEAADAVKARALGLLSDLQAPMPQRIQLRDPEALLGRSVRELLDGLDSPDEVDTAVALIVDQVPELEVPAFVSELVRHGGKKAAPVIRTLSARGGLSDDTLAALDELYREATATAADRAALEALERGLEYLEAGRPRAARRRLERFVTRQPDSAEGRSALGVCLLELDDVDGAIDHLAEAIRLEPTQPLHRWNLASAAKQADRMGGCYLALRDYLSLGDESDGYVERRTEAKSFVRAYERMLRSSHPGVPLRDVLRGEELFARAYAALSEGKNLEAANGFENVLALVPRHYPSWGNLGAAYLALDRTAEAKRCLERALELNPEYTVAKHNLLLIQAGR